MPETQPLASGSTRSAATRIRFLIGRVRSSRESPRPLFQPWRSQARRRDWRGDYQGNSLLGCLVMSTFRAGQCAWGDRGPAAVRRQAACSDRWPEGNHRRPG